MASSLAVSEGRRALPEAEPAAHGQDGYHGRNGGAPAAPAGDGDYDGGENRDRTGGEAVSEPKWLTIARAEIGQREVAGGADNQRILEYFRATTFPATHDEVPWCSAFANWCLSQSGITGTRSAAAKSWTAWGAASVPEPGAIIVLQHQAGPDAATGSASGYHVGFYLSQDSTHIHLLGGNQGDSVKESAFPLATYHVAACRWPSEAGI